MTVWCALRQDDGAVARDVFLYDRRLMVAGPQALVPEQLPALRVQGAPSKQCSYTPGFYASLCCAPRAPLVRRAAAMPLSGFASIAAIALCCHRAVQPVCVHRQCVTIVSPPAADVETASLQYEPHELDAAPSPLLRFLPVYERDFRGHLLRARSLWEASQTRLRDAEQLLSEMVRTHAG